MEGAERDTTQDWLVPRGAVPTIGQLEERIDEAVVVARASEEGVREVGEMAIDAAKQARRAAEAAEESARSAAAARKALGPAGPVADLAPPPAAGAAGAASSGGSPKSVPPPGSDAERQPPREVVIDPLRRFNERADAISARLKKLERVRI